MYGIDRLPHVPHDWRSRLVPLDPGEGLFQAAECLIGTRKSGLSLGDRSFVGADVGPWRLENSARREFVPVALWAQGFARCGLFIAQHQARLLSFRPLSPGRKSRTAAGRGKAHQYQCFFGTPCLMRTCQSQAMSAAPDSSTRRHHRSDLMLLLSQSLDDRSRVGLRTFLQCSIPPLSCTVQMLGRGCRLILGAPSELTGSTSTDAPCPLSWIRGWATRT
jgi:hypothetical protein